jgi:hypothetical protein
MARWAANGVDPVAVWSELARRIDLSEKCTRLKARPNIVSRILSQPLTRQFAILGLVRG